jgi:hypothetical protein
MEINKGKVFRNLAKRKLAEYIREKEEKGEQEAHSETVGQIKAPIQSSEQRKRYAIDLDFIIEGKKVPVKMNVNLSIPERRKFANYVKYISNAIKLQNSTVLVERLNNLLKRIVAEKDNYSIDFSNAMRDLLKVLNNKLDQIVPEAGRKEGLEGVRNVFNQLVELFEERLGELMPIEEGTPAQEEKIQQVKIPVGENTKTKIKIHKKRELQNPTITGKNQKKRNELKNKARKFYDDEYENVVTIANKNKLYKLLNDFIIQLSSETFTKGLTKEQMQNAYDAIETNIKTNLIPASAPAQIEEEADINPFSSLQEEEEEEEAGGMRKGRHNTHRGYIGYGHERGHLDISHGFATAPMNANSPFGQKGFRAPQSNAIPKYLNFEIIPNKRGNFAVLE